MPLAIGGILVAVSGPAVLIASLKLRQRNLGPLLDASGWAVNARARINIPFGGSLTGIATLPSGSSRSLRDPYAESNTTRNTTLAFAGVLVVLTGVWFFGVLNPWVPWLPKSAFVLQREAATVAAPPAAPVAPAPAPAPQ